MRVIKRKTAALIIGALLVAVALGGCAGKQETSTEEGEKKFVIGASLMNTVEPFYKDIEEGWRDAAGKYGAEVIVTSAEGDLAKQVSQTEDFITNKVDAIILCPADSAGIVPAVEKANEARIPVITCDINAEGGDVTSFVASDNYKGGQLAAEFMAKELNGEGELVILDHPQITSVYQRVQGFVDEIAKHPGMKIVQRPEVPFARDVAMKTTEDMLVTYPNLKGIFGAVGADAGLGALAAVEAAGRSDVLIVNFDAVPESRDLIYNGNPCLRADVAQFAYLIGYQSMEVAIKHLQGEDVPKEVAVEVLLVTKDNLVKQGDRILIKGYEDKE